jgi:hypothetical protein|tara:strand:+ start:773 stop:1255 length:483 start_codon:yes stop_codon:yes gene_type:complete
MFALRYAVSSDINTVRLTSFAGCFGAIYASKAFNRSFPGLITDMGFEGEMICELKVNRHETSLHVETFNDDDTLDGIWDSLFAVEPGARSGRTLELQEPDRTVTWQAGFLQMDGAINMRVWSHKRKPDVKKLTLTKVKKKKRRKKRGGSEQPTTNFVDAI